jgi:hypothetical protein
MQNIQDLKQEIAFINDFTNGFFSKTNSLNSRASTTIQKLDDIIAVEKKNEEFLSNLENSLADSELSTLTESLQTFDTLLSDKQKEYLSIIEKNSKRITNISNIIRNKQSIVSNIQQLAEKIDINISLIDVKSDKTIP